MQTLPAVAAPRHNGAFFRALAGLVIVLLLASFDQHILNTALPRIARELGGLTHLSWIVSGFMITSTLSTPLYGKLADRYGGKPVICTAIALFLAGSMLCGISQSLEQLIAFRMIQGAGAGGLISLVQLLVADLVGPERRGRYQGFITGAFTLSNIAGPLIGGALTLHLSWRWCFYVNLPLGIIGLCLIIGSFRESRYPSRDTIDYLGGLWLSAATIPVLLLLSSAGSGFGWLSLQAAALVAAAAIFLMLFLRRENRVQSPFLGTRLFSNRTFLASSICSATVGFCTFSVNVFSPTYFQLVRHLDPIEAAMMIWPQVFAMLFSAIIGGRYFARHGFYKTSILVGIMFELIALIGLATAIATHAEFAVFRAAYIFMGLGMGVTWPNMTTVVQNSVSSDNMGTATSALSFLRSLGAGFGVAVAGGIIAHFLNTPALPSDLALQRGTTIVFSVFSGVMLITFLMARKLFPDETQPPRPVSCG